MRPTMAKYEVTVGENDYTVCATYHRFSRGYFERGGQQIDPDEPAHFDIDTVIDSEGNQVNPNDDDTLMDAIHEQLMEQVEPSCDEREESDDE